MKKFGGHFSGHFKWPFQWSRSSFSIWYKDEPFDDSDEAMAPLDGSFLDVSSIDI
jgi:hypothetical protein